MANAVNYLSQIQTGQTIQAVHVNQFVNALSGSEAYDLKVSGSLTVIGPLYATASWATNALNSKTADSASKEYIASNSSTNAEYTLVFKNSTAALNDYHQLAADGSNGPYYNPSTNTLTVPVISGSSVQATSFTGSFLGNINGSSSYATTASYALTSSYASNGVTDLSVGAFYDTTTQTLASNVSGAMTYNSITVSDGISVVSNSRLTVTRAGTYNIQFSSQFIPAGQGGVVYIWLRKNGTDVPYSNTEVHMQNSNQALVAAWNFIETLTPGQYLELMWYPIGATVDMATEVPTPGPAGNGNVGVPSVIVTMTQIK
jgi:hypothetical protein